MKKPLLFILLFVILCAAPFSSGHSHHLIAHGSHGWVRFWGLGKVHLSGRGTLTVKNASNLRLKIDGKHTEEKKLADGFEYRHFQGSVESIGPGAHLELRGWDIKLEINGFGKAYFHGKGSYTLDGNAPVKWPEKPGAWKKVRFRK